jgi:hypothetical protein
MELIIFQMISSAAAPMENNGGCPYVGVVKL